MQLVLLLSFTAVRPLHLRTSCARRRQPCWPRRFARCSAACAASAHALNPPSSTSLVGARPRTRQTREREAQLAAEAEDDEIVFSDEEDD